MLLALLLARGAAAAEPEPLCDVATPPTDPRPAPVTLADAAKPHGLAIGSVANAFLPWPIGPRYKSLLGREFSIFTPGNEMKWAVVQAERNVYSFWAADCLLRLAEVNGQRVRGHTLVWHAQNPAWLPELELSREGWIELLRQHVTTVVGHFRSKFPGRVVEWDVVNEPIANEACQGKDRCALRNNLWAQKIGPEYVALAFRFAHQADPDARLYLNEIGLELRGAHADMRRTAFLHLLDVLRTRQVPVHGVGLQAHLGLHEALLPLEDLRPLFSGIVARDLDIAITELDVRLPGSPDAQSLAAQAAIYRQVLKACLDEPRCKTFIIWGFTDMGHWLKTGTPAPMDLYTRPKPAWYAMLEELRQHPVTPRAGTAPPAAQPATIPAP